jgi:thiol-disulfide isomerase/thioredoxin
MSLFAMALLLTAGQADVDPGVKAYVTLLREHEEAMTAFRTALEAARTPAERQTVFRDKHPKNADYARKFLEAARKHPDSPAAIDALTWVVLHPVEAEAPEAKLRGEAVRALLKKPATDNRLGILCTRLVQSVDPDSNAFLQGMLERGEGENKGRATAARAHNLRHRCYTIRALKEDKDAVGEYERIWGKEAIAQLLKQSPDELEKESEKLFRAVIEKYAKQAHPTHGDLGSFARAHLAAMKEPVTVGKPAPEIEGKDLNGKEMKLSSFRGKVVLIDFHAHAFEVCREMFATEAALLKKYADRPFVLVGVNGDASRVQARLRNGAAGVTWPSWHDGGGMDGPIAIRWDVDRWPTLALIGPDGVVAAMWTGWPEVKELEQEVNALLAKAEKK